MVKSKEVLVVIGGGAAGFFCAVNAARLKPGMEVIIVEKTSKLLSKVKVSGGGRCNVTQACFDIGEMSKRYPRGKNFVKRAFHQFFTTDTIKWFEERDVILKTEEDGRMFPITDSSQTIISCLLNEATRYQVKLMLNTEVKNVKKNSRFSLELASKSIINADYICVACGGYPKTDMFAWLAATGHSIIEPVPSLFTFNLPKHPISSLMGISVESARVKIEGTKLAEQGALLITHWGLSGPAVLKLSAWGARELKEKNYSFRIHINWLPHTDEEGIKMQIQSLRRLSASKKIANLNFTNLPGRLWEFLLKESGIDPSARAGELVLKAENKLVRHLLDYTADVNGKTTFKEEFVTAGGIQLTEVDVNTMMSKRMPGLFFAGEVLDVDGITGGYNFQHAWTSGYIAAKSIASFNPNH